MQITDMLYVSFAFYHVSSEKYVCKSEGIESAKWIVFLGSWG